jgi:2-methylisocitrate lyase-like PEP mutase family enzyme
MSIANDARAQFLSLHRRGRPLLLPNPWDVGSARLLATLGFGALATTSSGFAGTLGRMDGSITREQALAHAATIAAATALPVTADLENGFADTPDGVASTVLSAAGLGLAGCSIEDFTGDDSAPIYQMEHSAERIAAAAEAAHRGSGLVLTARAENYLHGRPDLADTISRLQAFQTAGADVLYAPGLRSLSDIATVIGAVDVPVNVLLLPGGPSVAELTDLGAGRISIGGTFAFAALGALAEAGRQFLAGSTEFFTAARLGREAAQAAFEASPG